MQFLYPSVLFLLILVIVLFVFNITKKDKMKQFFSKEILNKLTIKSNALTQKTRDVLIFLALILIIFSLARPITNEQEHFVKQQLIPIVVALDVSKSMYAQDIYPTRLEFAKKKLQNIIKLSQDMAIGIVLFSKDSYILSPITEDIVSLEYIINNINTELNLNNGSNIYALLETTKQMLETYNTKNLIILSDGANNKNYQDELNFAKQEKISVYAIGIATKNGAAIPTKNGYVTDKNNKIITVALNTKIKDLAINSGGGYIDFTLSNEDIKAILTQIKAQNKKENINNKKIKTHIELFYYPLILALILLLISFSSLPRFKNIAVVFLFVLLPQVGYSGILDYKTLYDGNKYYKKKDYKKAIDLYNKIDAQNKNLKFKALHNLGNSYVKLDKLEEAKKIYEKALKIKNDKETKANLEMVKKELEKRKKKQQNKKKDKNKKQNKKNKKKDKNNKQNKKSKKKDNKSNKQKNKQKKQGQQKQKIKDEPISKMEEKKWLKALQKKKTPIMLRKVKIKKYQNKNMEQPW
jgi:Ca-activated chloride channel family protein